MTFLQRDQLGERIMNFGVPDEISIEERRVALTPVGVYALINEGNTVFVDKGAGVVTMCIVQLLILVLAIYMEKVYSPGLKP